MRVAMHSTNYMRASNNVGSREGPYKYSNINQRPQIMTNVTCQRSSTVFKGGERKRKKEVIKYFNYKEAD